MITRTVIITVRLFINVNNDDDFREGTRLPIGYAGCRERMRGRGTWAEELAGLGGRWRVGVEEEGGV